METRRWLLPFTYGVNMQAIEYALRLAESSAATVVAVALVSIPEAGRPRGARLEDIQQSKDFLEAVKWKAARLRIPVERHEVFTTDVIGSIAILTYELHCDSIILVSGGKREVFLQAHELKHLLSNPPATFVLLRLPAPRERAPHLLIRLLSWLRHWPRRQQNDVCHGLEQDAPGAEEASWTRIGENSRR